jgi:hypothetical protein
MRTIDVDYRFVQSMERCKQDIIMQTLIDSIDPDISGMGADMTSGGMLIPYMSGASHV